MTDANVIKLKMIEALISAIDQDDERDAEQAIEMIRALLATGK